MSPPAANPAPGQWPPESCAEVQLWLNARLDGECTPAQEGWLVDHLNGCAACAREWAALERTRLLFATASLREAADHERQALARVLVPRWLLGLGWLLLGAGALLLLGWAGWLLWHDEETPPAIRLALAAVAAGTLLLLARYAWERWRVRQVDPYRDVLR